MTELSRKGSHPIPPFATNTQKGLIIKPFTFKGLLSAKSVPAIRPYKKLAYREGKRNYVSFYYRIPPELSDQHGGAEYKRFRLFETLNDSPDPVANRVAGERLIDSLITAFDQGLNPFSGELEFMQLKPQLLANDQVVQAIIASRPMNVVVSLKQALENFLKDCAKRGLRGRTIGTYKTAVNHLKTQFADRLDTSVVDISYQDIDGFLDTLREDNEWSGQTFNNNLTQLKAIFNWMMDKRRKYITENPCDLIDELPVDTKANEHYTKEQAAAIKKLLLAGNANAKYCHQFCEFGYYTAIRPREETRWLKVEHMQLDRRLVYVPGEINKNGKAEFVPMCDELYNLLTKEMRIQDYPGNYYLFSLSRHPDKTPVSINHFAKIYKPFKDQLGLTRHSIYSWKHTRVIHLVEAGADPYEIMRLCRHSSLTETMNYLRGLGAMVSTATNTKTKKF
jgi:site-specific recombinase XerD